MKPDYGKLLELLAAARYGVDVKKLRGLAGLRFPDGGGYEFQVQDDVSFVITGTPDDDVHNRGAVIRTGHAAWGAIAALALAQIC